MRKRKSCQCGREISGAVCIVNGVVIEIDMNTDSYNLVYDAEGVMNEFRTGHNLNEMVTKFLNSAVHPKDKVIATEHLLKSQKDFFEAGLRRQTRRYRVRSAVTEDYHWVDVTHLRVYTERPKDRKALCVIQRESIRSGLRLKRF